MDNTRQFHPVADLFPLLRGESFQALVADIKNNGLREPIIEDAEGRILDGRNRYRACLEAGVDPRFVQWQSDGSPAAFALSQNLHRRHLDESQRAFVAARLARLLENEAAKRKGRRTDLAANLQRGQDRRSATQAAALVNVSTRLVQYALRILRDGSPELIAAVESGGMAVSKAASLARLPQPEQAQALAAGVPVVPAKARTLPRAPSCSGSFGRYADQPSQDGIVLLWVDAKGLAHVIKALQAQGFRYSG
jgi:hypothetical protein